MTEADLSRRARETAERCATLGLTGTAQAFLDLAEELERGKSEIAEKMGISHADVRSINVKLKN